MAGPTALAVEPHAGSGDPARAGRRRHVPLVDAAGAARGCPAGSRAARLQPLARTAGRASSTSSSPSPGWARGRDVPSAELLGVHRRHDPPPPPRRAGPRGGRRTSAAGRRRAPRRGRPAAASPPSERSRSSSPGAAERAAQVAAEEPERRDRLAWPAGPRSTTARASASERTTTPSPGQRPGRPPGLTLADRHPAPPRRRPSSSAELAATTPRNSASAAWRARAAVAADRRDVADLAQQVDELLHVADEVAAGELLVLEHVVEVARPPPTRGRGARSPGSGGRVGGRPASSSSAVSSSASRSRRWNRSRTVELGNHGSGGRLAAAVLVGEARTRARPATAASRSSRTPGVMASATSRSHSW